MQTKNAVIIEVAGYDCSNFYIVKQRSFLQAEIVCDGKTCWPQVAPAAPFIGYYLRLEILNQNGYKEEVVKNIKDYFTEMVEETGTLWVFIIKLKREI